MLCKYDKSIGYPSGGKIHLNSNAWVKITELVKELTGFDLLAGDINDLSKLNRVDVSLVMNNEKSLGRAPSEGFVMGRLLGSGDTLNKDTKGFCNNSTPLNSYIGVHISDIQKWSISNLIIMENLAAFLAFNKDHSSKITGLNAEESALVIYRGHNSSNHIYRLIDELKALEVNKYVFADYDIAGLNISEAIAEKINADGYILPLNKDDLKTLIKLTKSIEREKQSSITVSESTLLPFYQSLKHNFIGVTQESLMAHEIPLTVVERVE